MASAVGLVKMALDEYDRLGDPRVSDWPFMASPFPTIAMVLVYLYFVLFVGPWVMANRKPFKLRKILVVYNSAQVVFSLVMLWEHLMSGWLLDYSYACEPVDYSRDPKAMRMVTLCWWYYISKLTEFADTFFFILRKKDSQVTLLHLYHHSLTPLETWICCKFIAGGHGTFSNLLNNGVHVVMYAYYAISALGPEYQKYVWWKKYLTTMQLVQFSLVFVHSAQAVYLDCGYPRLIAGLLLLHSAIFFGLFSDFYVSTYRTRNRRMALAGRSLVSTNGYTPKTTDTCQNGYVKSDSCQNGYVKNDSLQKRHVKDEDNDAKTIQNCQNGHVKLDSCQNGTVKSESNDATTIPSITNRPKIE